MKVANWLSILFFSAIFALLYFGCDTKSKDQVAVEKSRALNFEKVNIQKLTKESFQKLPEEKKAKLLFLDSEYQKSEDSLQRIELLKQISGFWYDEGNKLLSANYAKEIAQNENSGNAWSISGTSFYLAMIELQEENQKAFAFDNAISSFDNAISMNPENIQHRVNRALCYVENPPEENPMFGIQQLLTLNRENPTEASVLVQLARLGMRTGQYDKAQQRLETILNGNPKHKQANCLMAELMNLRGELENGQKFSELCTKLN